MPNNLIKPFADKSGLPVEEVEKRWDKAKKIAIDAGFSEEKDGEDYWAYVVGILKKSLGITEEGEAIGTLSSTGLDGGIPASGSGMATTHVKLGSKRKKRKHQQLINFKEYLEYHLKGIR